MRLHLFNRLLPAAIFLCLAQLPAFSQEKNNKNIVVESDIENPLQNPSDLIKDHLEKKGLDGKKIAESDEISDKISTNKNRKALGSKLSTADSLVDLSKSFKSFSRIIDPDLSTSDRFDEVADLPLEQVFSKKDWMTFKDSLVLMDGINQVRSEKKNFSGKQLGEEDIIGFVNRKSDNRLGFMDKANDENKLPQFGQGTPFGNILPNEDGQIPNLDNLKPELFSLPLLQSRIIDKDLLSALDSLSNAALADRKMVNHEVLGSGNAKVAKYKEKKAIFDKFASDVVIGMFTGEELKFQASPALTYQFNHDVSVGIGPSFMVSYLDKNTLSTIGVRSFVRKEFLNKKLYVQLENQLADTRFDYKELDEIRLNEQRNLIGAGYLLTFSSRYSLNIGAFYQLTGFSDEKDFQPFLLRIGLSSIK